jgi:hypothetical protein
MAKERVKGRGLQSAQMGRGRSGKKDSAIGSRHSIG